jgi:phosphoglycerol transferase
MEFPEEPRNLIMLFLEGMEVTYASKEYGGNQEINLIPNLTKMALDNTSFSNGAPIGGTIDVAWFTSPGLLTQISGLPLKTNLDVHAGAFKNEYLPGAYMLGDILEAQGYYLQVMFGSDARFGTRDKLFQGHGGFEIFDLYTARERGYIPPDYEVWWGFEDEKLFEYMKMELLNLAAGDLPFGLVALTVDTHHFDGYRCHRCPNVFEPQLFDVVACSDQQIEEFINWLQEQSFYENTTLVLVGDHLCMSANYFKDPAYERRVFNTFINAVPSAPAHEKERLFTSLDIFPTVLAAMGVEIEGDRLAMGVNLFSEQPTLIQKYGMDFFRIEIRKNSFFYNTNIMDPTDYLPYLDTLIKISPDQEDLEA